MGSQHRHTSNFQTTPLSLLQLNAPLLNMDACARAWDLRTASE